MNLIVAVDKNWGIGKNNDLLYSIPADMKFFRETTSGKVVVMGRKTLLSFPGSKPLKNRINIVLSKNTDFNPEGVVMCRNTDELFKKLKEYNTDDVFVIGGKTIYEELLYECDKLYITKMYESFEADTYIKNIDEDDNFTLEYQSEISEHEGVKYCFCTYINNRRK